MGALRVPMPPMRLPAADWHPVLPANRFWPPRAVPAAHGRAAASIPARSSSRVPASATAARTASSSKVST